MTKFSSALTLYRAQNRELYLISTLAIDIVFTLHILMEKYRVFNPCRNIWMFAVSIVTELKQATSSFLTLFRGRSMTDEEFLF